MIPALGHRRLVQEHGLDDAALKQKAKNGRYHNSTSSLNKSSRSSISSISRSTRSLELSLNGLRPSKSRVFEGKKYKAKDNLRLKTPFERKLVEFDYKLDLVAAKILNNQQNMALNSETTGSNRLLRPSIVSTLRYTYFERFTTSYEDVATQLGRLPKPEYWAKVWDLDAYNHSNLFGDSCKKNSVTIDHVLVKKSYEHRKNTEKCFKEGTKVVPYEEDANRTTCIRNVFRTTSFWQNVFFDAREATETDNIDEWFPPLETVQRFFMTLCDYVLYNLHSLECNVSEEEKKSIPPDEIRKLAHQYFYYFNDSDYAFFEMLARVFNNTFMLQVRTYMNKEDAVAVKTKEVIMVLLEAVRNNLHITYFGAQGVDEMLEVWHDFLLMAIDRLVVANVKPVLRAELKKRQEHLHPPRSQGLDEGASGSNQEAKKEVPSSAPKKKTFFGRLRRQG